MSKMATLPEGAPPVQPAGVVNCTVNVTGVFWAAGLGLAQTDMSGT